MTWTRTPTGCFQREAGRYRFSVEPSGRNVYVLVVSWLDADGKRLHLPPPRLEAVVSCDPAVELMHMADRWARFAHTLDQKAALEEARLGALLAEVRS